MTFREQRSVAGGKLGRGRPATGKALPPALVGERHALMVDGARVVFYARALALPSSHAERPLLLVHSVNAVASAYEVRPLFDHYVGRRPVYALDLPGFGLSDRSDRAYTPRLMIAAIDAVAEEARRENAGMAPDVLGLSLSCEFLARAALAAPARYHTLALVSPTGFDRRTPPNAPPGKTRDTPLLRRILLRPLKSDRIFRALVRPSLIRASLRKAWGSRQINDGLARYGWLSVQQPGAAHAPRSFVSGSMLSCDIRAVYRALQLPVWLVHGSRGDFVDYRHVADIQARANWAIDVLPTGAFPHFEQRDEFVRRYEGFLAAVAATQPLVTSIRLSAS